MKALVYDAPARRLSLQDAADPAPLPGEVLLTPAYGAICGSDLHMYAGSEAYRWMPSPMVIGHEVAGRIPGSDRLFVVNPYLPCGRCKMCRLGNTSTCMGRRAAVARRSRPGRCSMASGGRADTRPAWRCGARTSCPRPPGCP